jgi:putative phage-type endonuclease
MSLDHAARAKGIGASELAAILGLDPYRTPLDVWMEKTGRKPKFEGNEATFRGNVFEDAVGQYMQRAIGEDCVQEKCSFVVSDISEVIRCNPDRIYYNRKTGERKGGELKTTIERVTEEDLTDPENPKKLPWLFQCQWCMVCTGLRKWELGWLGAFFNYTQVTIEYNEGLANMLTDFVLDWWDKHIVNDIQPDPVNAADALVIWPKDNGEAFEANDTLADLIRDYASAKGQAKAWAEKADSMADRIKLAFGACSYANIQGNRAASYKADKRGIKSLRTSL